MSTTSTTEVAVQAERLPEFDALTASDLERWARDLRVAYTIARQLVTTSFVPGTYQGKPQEAAAAMMAGQELGLSPLAALRSIDIIQGVPALRAITLRALVQARGFDIWTVESTKTQAVVAGRRRGSETVEKSVWTIERARDLKLTGKDNWQKQPIAMLLARATSELVRLIAADVVLGIPYTVEELADAEEPRVEDAPRKGPAKRTAQRAPLPAAEEAELLEAEPAPPVEVEADPGTGEVTPEEPPLDEEAE